MRQKLIKSEVIQLFKTTKETLRYYEKEGLIKPEIDENGYRYYGFRDLEKLRQIFFLRDIDLSIGEMRQIEEKSLCKADYIKLLDDHEKALASKIQHLADVKNRISQLIQLEIEDSEDVTFQVGHHQERQMIVYEDLDSHIYHSAKAYYDHYINLIQLDTYSERTFQMIYAYDALGSGKKIKAKQCIEIPEAGHKKVKEKGSKEIVLLPEGLYLSVYYTFQEGRFEGLPHLKEQIDRYMDAHGISMIKQDVIEIEHPELSLFESEASMIFELQLHVRITP